MNSYKIVEGNKGAYSIGQQTLLVFNIVYLEVEL